MIIGLLTSSPLFQRLLCEQLDTAYTITCFSTEEALKEALVGGVIRYGLQEGQQQLTLSTVDGAHVFCKPLYLPHVLHSLSTYMTQQSHKVGPYLFLPQARLLENVRKGRSTIQLREKETELLLFLLTAPGKYASRQTLLQHIWGFQPGMETRTLETHVYQLRQKIEKNHQKPELLVNDEAGYRLVI